MLISVSRRTDIPAFFMPWLMKRVREKKAVYYNPFSFKGYEISLCPEDVDAMIFISKNYAPLLPHLTELQSLYNLYFHFTITGLAGIFEERVPPAREMVTVFQELARRTSAQQVAWRFDPLVLTNITPPEYFLEQFQKLACELEGFTERCYFSFATIYDKVKRTFHQLEEKKGVQLLETNLELYRQVADELAHIGREHGIQLYSCCNDFLVNGLIEKGHCVDGDYLGKLFHLTTKFSSYPTRDGCGCVKCVDLGVYDTCPHGCSYCYANFNKSIAWKNYQAHSPDDEILTPEKITVVKRLSVERDEQGEQTSLF